MTQDNAGAVHNRACADLSRLSHELDQCTGDEAAVFAVELADAEAVDDEEDLALIYHLLNVSRVSSLTGKDLPRGYAVHYDAA